MKGFGPVKRIVFAAFIVCMTFASVIPAISENSAAMPGASECDYKTSQYKQYLEEAVTKLMQEGKLSQEKVDKILEYKKKKADEMGKLSRDQLKELKKNKKQGSLLGDMVSNGIITEDEAQLIKEKLREMKEKRMNDGMQSLLDKGVLTQKDIENIRSYMLKVREEREAQIEKLKTMTEEERKEYFAKAKKDRKDILTRMVEDKVITKEQAEEIRKAIPELGKSKHRRF